MIIGIFWAIIILGVFTLMYILSTFWFLVAAWIFAMVLLAARPNHRQNVWANYLFVIGIVAIIVFLVGKVI